MAHRLHRLLTSVWNTPHLVTESALRPIVDYLQVRSLQANLIIMPEMEPTAPSDNDGDEPDQADDVGEIQIDGVLTYKPVVGMCGPMGVSYQGILEQAEELIESGVKTLIMTHSSPGGQASHCFTTALDLRSMCDEAGVKLITYIDTMSCSAALAIGVVADEVYIHPSAETGSIGCVVALMDQSKALAQAGLKPIFIASSPGKTAFNNDGSFSDSFLADVQEQVTNLGDQFAAHVSEFTGIPVEDIVAMDAKSFNAYDAVEVGLANAVMDHKQFLSYISGPMTND